MQVVDMLCAKSFSEDAVRVLHEYIIAANSLGLEALSSEDFATALNKIIGPLASGATVQKTLRNAAWPGGEARSTLRWGYAESVEATSEELPEGSLMYKCSWTVIG